MIRWLAVLLTLLAPPALAQEPTDEVLVVAIVPLDGAPGTSSRDMAVVVRGLADAIGRDGRVVVVSGEALVGRLTAAKQSGIQEARDAFAEGQLLLEEGDPDIGLAFLAEAVDAHDRAASAVVRREEMADAAFVLARALVEVGQEDAARDALTRALRLLPDYLDTQTEASDPRLRVLAQQIEASLATRPPRRLSLRGASALAVDLQVDRIVHGVVMADGQLELRLFRDGEVTHTEVRPGPFYARRLGDSWYAELGKPLVDAAIGVPVAGPRRVESPPAVPTPPPTTPRRRSGAAVALGVTGAVLVAGAATAAVIATRPGGPAPDGWELQVNLVR